jgi:DNA-binding beta-propeller fold protein YncE
MTHPRPFAALSFGIAVHALLVGCATSQAPDEGSIFYPPPPQRPRIQFLTSIAGAKDVEGATSPMMKFLVGDMKSQRNFRKPTGVTSHAGAIYVADPGWDTVIVADLANKVFDTLRDRGTGKLQVPVAVAVDADGNKFVADTGRNQVVQFNTQNEFVRAFGNPEVLKPTGVAVDERLLYVVNRNEHRVEVFDRFSKERVRTFGEFGTADGQFNIPTSITRDHKGHLFVTDATNFRIQEFDSEGIFVKSYGFLGDGPGTFARPRGLGVDRDEHLYTVDGAFENVQIWDVASAQVLLAFGGPGSRAGNMYLPASVHIDYELREYFVDLVDPDFELEYVILVVNNYGPNKLAVYGFVTPKDPSRYPDYKFPDRDSEG